MPAIPDGTQSACWRGAAKLTAMDTITQTREGRQRLYQLEARELKRVYEWASKFERLWTHQLDRIKERAERKATLRMS